MSWQSTELMKPKWHGALRRILRRAANRQRHQWKYLESPDRHQRGHMLTEFVTVNLNNYGDDQVAALQDWANRAYDMLYAIDCDQNERRAGMNDLSTRAVRVREAAFESWWPVNAGKLGFDLLEGMHKAMTLGFMRLAFNAGSNWERRHNARRLKLLETAIARQEKANA